MAGGLPWFSGIKPLFLSEFVNRVNWPAFSFFRDRLLTRELPPYLSLPSPLVKARHRLPLSQATEPPLRGLRCRTNSAGGIFAFFWVRDCGRANQMRFSIWRELGLPPSPLPLLKTPPFFHPQMASSPTPESKVRASTHPPSSAEPHSPLLAYEGTSCRRVFRAQFVSLISRPSIPRGAHPPRRRVSPARFLPGMAEAFRL